MAWLPMMVLAILNGFVRELLYGPLMSELAANQVSCVSAIVLFSAYAVWLGSRFPLTSYRQAIMAGLIWLTLTLLFEFGMVSMMPGISFESAIADFNLSEGRMWVLVLAAVGTLPVSVFHFRTSRCLPKKGSRGD